MSSIRATSVHTSDGWFLRGEVSSEGEKDRPVVVLLHAMMASRKTMDRPRGAGFGSVLATRGYGVVAFDLRGHGESSPSARDGARYTYDDYVLHDIPAVVRGMREMFPDRRIVIAGHSLGAHTTLVFSGLFPDQAPDAVVSLGGNMWIPSFEPDFVRRTKKLALLAAFRGVAESIGYVDPKTVRMGTDAVPLPYVRQLWTMWRTDRYGSLDGQYDYRQALGHVNIPVFSVASEGDALLAHPIAVDLFLEPIAKKYVTARLLRSSDLGAPAPDHMGLVTNAVSRIVWEEIADWIGTLT